MSAATGTSAFSVTIILPAIDETWSLRETLTRIESASSSDVLQYLIVLSPKYTSAACREVAEALAVEFPGRVQLLEQRLPFLGGAVRDGFDATKGTHVIMMSSDLETDPATVPLLIAEAKLHPAAIITATRWKDGAVFEGYDPLKLVLNKIFQGFFALLYRVRLTDLTFAYRIFPTSLVQSIRWEELKHPFLFETIIKPLRLGVEVVEVASSWRARTEGVSHNTFLTNFVYFRIGLKTLFKSPRKILKDAA
jgi:glycosyltransferase involved in cell wall biosynthesis